ELEVPAACRWGRWAAASGRRCGLRRVGKRDGVSAALEEVGAGANRPLNTGQEGRRSLSGPAVGFDTSLDGTRNARRYSISAGRKRSKEVLRELARSSTYSTRTCSAASSRSISKAAGAATRFTLRA